jgi:hypothetical protein
MSNTATVMPVLEERHSGFNYGYWMKCECGGTSYISAADYHAEQTVDALMPCDHCDRTIHFGPAVAALRDQDDPALDNARINQLAWYHTSASRDWPSMTYASERREQLLAGARRLHLPADRVNYYVERELSLALHVGTYEAADENMLRRMHDQDDAASQFYLHRVSLTVDPVRVDGGYRDENDEPAAKLATTDLRTAGLDAVRYLNVHECAGSLSLAVLPETISRVQTIGLPVASLAPAHPASLLNLLDQVQRRLDDLRATAPDTSGIAPRRLRMMQLGGARDPDGIGAASAQHERNRYELWDSVNTALAKQYLADISPLLLDEFEQAMSAWHREQAAPTVRAVADFFAASAIALTHPSAITDLPTAQEPRAVTGTTSAQS